MYINKTCNTPDYHKDNLKKYNKPAMASTSKQILPLPQSKPAKPLSAYGLFFRDTVHAIKRQNPTSSFQELSKIVASMWDVLDASHKEVYQNKSELSKKEFLKHLGSAKEQQKQLDANTIDTLHTDGNGGQQTRDQQVDDGDITAKDASCEHQTRGQAADNNNQINNTITTITNHSDEQSGAQCNIQVSVSTEDASGEQQTRVQQVDNSDNQTSNTITTTTTRSDEKSVAQCNTQMGLSTENSPLQQCLRRGCIKPAIRSVGWEDEYCSNECVVIHCREVFNAWVRSNLGESQ